MEEGQKELADGERVQFSQQVHPLVAFLQQHLDVGGEHSVGRQR